MPDGRTWLLTSLAPSLQPLAQPYTFLGSVLFDPNGSVLKVADSILQSTSWFVKVAGFVYRAPSSSLG